MLRESESCQNATGYKYHENAQRAKAARMQPYARPACEYAERVRKLPECDRVREMRERMLRVRKLPLPYKKPVTYVYT